MPNNILKLEQYLYEHQGDYNGENMRLREVAYRRLYDALRNVDLEPGEPLPELRLSKALGISRTPVREALQQLAADGMIQIIQGRAVTIVARSVADVLDALHIRELLEPQAVKLCVQTLSDAELERLQELTRLMEEAAKKADRSNWSRTDREWHEIICNGCPNKLLGEMVLLARNRMYHKGSSEHVTEQYLIDGTAEHKLIVEAIIAQDAERAEQLTLAHLRELKHNIFRRFGKL
jgi:DNA-binding GntR family transcriptional regulator